MFVSQILDGAAIKTRIGDKFVIDCDQPAPFGEDKGPSPYDVFLASVAACAAYFAQRYCRKWKLSHEGITVELEPTFGPQHSLTDLKLHLRVPASFPREHLDGLLRNAGACPVKKALETPPSISLDLIEA
jgi:ribosomal protein S12 methylthiotransferase accessory factor